MNVRRIRRIGALLLAGALGAAACTDAGGELGSGNGDGSSGGSDRPTDVTNLTSDEVLLTAALQTVDSCDALLDRITTEAVERVGAYGFDGHGGPVFFEGDIAIDEEAFAADGDDSSADVAESAPAAELAQGTSRDAEGGGFSETNNQEVGVDEADLVKTDGQRLVIASGNTLRVIDVTGPTPRLADTIELPDDAWGGQLFLSGDRALIMTSGWTERPLFARDGADLSWYPGSPIGRLIDIDLNEGRVARTFEFEGSYLSAREVGGTIRIVLTATADRFSFVYPSNEGAVEAAAAANRALIESSTIDQWIPTYRITEGQDVIEEGPIVDCERVHLPGQFAGFGSLVMLTADIDQGLTVSDSVSVFTDAQTVYASTDRVAVATPRWPFLTEDGQPDTEEFNTSIHTFDITDPSRADYVASGSVRGHLLNQFSLSEYDGYLRVATTDGSPWWGAQEQSESFVTVLAEDGRELKTVGQVGGLGLGEQIFAVRFLGSTGYVVTFEQIDPLFTIDLSDPTDPRVLGELKIPGFSSYLHPVGEGHLLGVGTDGDDDGRLLGAAVSLFDVSDLTNPTLEAKLNLGPLGQGREGDSYTPVSDDAKAFTYWDGTAIIPVSWWSWDPEQGNEEQGSDVVLVEVDLDGNLTEIGRVDHPGIRECESGIYYEEPAIDEPASDDAEADFVDGEGEDAEAEFVDEELRPVEPPAEEFCYTWSPDIRRSVIIDGDLYTISEAGVATHRLDTLDEVSWIAFNR